MADLKECSKRRSSSTISFLSLPPEEAGERARGLIGGGRDDASDASLTSATADEASGWTDRIIQQMSNFLYQYRLELASMFRAFDVNNDGSISCQEFKVRSILREACLKWASSSILSVKSLMAFFSPFTHMAGWVCEIKPCLQHDVD